MLWRVRSPKDRRNGASGRAGARDLQLKARLTGAAARRDLNRSLPEIATILGLSFVGEAHEWEIREIRMLNSSW
jgi:hypothetical protein